MPAQWSAVPGTTASPMLPLFCSPPTSPGRGKLPLCCRRLLLPRRACFAHAHLAGLAAALAYVKPVAQKKTDLRISSALLQMHCGGSPRCARRARGASFRTDKILRK